MNGFNKDEKAIFVSRIRRNLIDSLGQLLEACQKYRIVHESILQVSIAPPTNLQAYFQDQVQKFLKFRSSIPDDEEADISIAKDMGSIMTRIWLSAPVQMVYKRRWSFALLDSAK